MSNPARIAVIGCGHMGQIHLQTLAQLPQAQVVAVVDPEQTHREKAATIIQCATYQAIEELSETIDAAVIASPSSTHHHVAKYFLGQGIPCFIEKPLAFTPTEVEDLLSYAKQVPILVGHSERYNPAFIALQQALKDEQIHSIAARRLNWASTRIVDTNVAMDLMVHDLDLVCSLLKNPVTKIQGTLIEDNHCDALLTFKSGVTANLTASRMSPCRLRELTVTTATAFYVADLLSHRLCIHHKGQTTPDEVSVALHKPLIMQYYHFFDVIAGKVQPQVSAAIAAQGLEVIWKLQEVAKR